VSYFVEIGNKVVINVIDTSKSRPLRRGQDVRLQVPPQQCGLLLRED